MNKKELKKYLEEREARWGQIKQWREVALNHPNYDLCEEKVDSYLRHDYYESGTILGISPTREGFNEMYEYDDLYRGGLCEIKVGDNYVIYGFEFD